MKTAEKLINGEKTNRFNRIAHELKHHIPYTVFSVALGIIVVSLITVFLMNLVGDEDHNATETEEHTGDDHAHEHEGVSGGFHDLFHVFHPIHILFSATATTAMFRRYDKKIYKAVIVGAVGALGVCAISDIFFPYIGGMVTGIDMELHVCLIQHPLTVIPFAVFGIIVGLFAADVFAEKTSTIFSHSGHIFISTMASILYLTAFGFADWMHDMFAVFIIITFAVLIPCCISDIIFPLAFANPENAPGCGCAPEKDHAHH